MIELELKPYDAKTADAVFSALFCKGIDREDGLKEIPSASLQLVVSALEFILWDVSGEDRITIKKAVGITEWLRDQQKMREWERRTDRPG